MSRLVLGTKRDDQRPFALQDVLKDTLCRLFGTSARFRPFQLDAMQALSDSKDTLLVLPTGTGKSLIYGLPPAALGAGNVSLVVTPLVALGKNQAKSLAEELDVDARLFTNSDASLEQQKKMADDLADPDGSIQVLITTPETLSRNMLLRGALSVASDLGKIFCVAIDEAHVAEPWGREFRPAYRQLPEILQVLNRKRIPMLACTASASKDAQMRIMDTLGMKKDCKVFVANADRSEIQLSVYPKELLDASEYPDQDPVVLKMAEYVEEGVAGLIFCRSKATVDRVASSLQAIDGLEDLVLAYHAGLESKVRERRQRAWEDGDVSVLVCTIAFGMGINKPDVRFVLHYDPPADLAEYLQQIGRAGRDGRLSRAVMFASHEEIEEGKRRDRHGGFQGVEEYVYSGSCRRKVLSSEFGDGVSCTGQEEVFKCDICRKTARLSEALRTIDRREAKKTLDGLNTRFEDDQLPSRPSVLQKVENMPPRPIYRKPSRIAQNQSRAVTAAFVNPMRRQNSSSSSM